jgi:hypothetical protein
MVNHAIAKSLKQRYNNIHPLVFQRSLDRAIDDTDLFDILDSFPNKYPVVWNNNERRWIVTDDLFLKSSFK